MQWKDFQSLRECPFCGGRAKFVHIFQNPEKCMVSCRECDGGIDAVFANEEAAAEAWNRRAQPNEPLTLDEMNALDHEPIYVLHTGGKWTMNGWHIATASSYQNHGRCDLEIDNGNTTIDMQNYGKTWLAYDHKPERSENDV